MSRVLDRWSEIDPIFTHALDLAEPERTDYVTQSCGEDPELCALVENLLASVGREGGVAEGGALDGPMWTAIDDIDEGTPAPETRIGPYRVVREIGRGGMAVVVLAERADGAFEQSVAIKILNTSFADPRSRLRFDRERHILARLDHPHIARLLDGGETDDGAPYLVMEYVEGTPIDAYADSLGDGRQTLDQRLSLLRSVADAVHHAHQNLVVHRDIKPSNVLVDARGRARLLDFGIAGLLDPEPDPSRTDITRAGGRPLTPAFASPEQARGEATTTASDVYQLGLLMYRALSGRMPYDVGGADEAEWRRIVCDVDAPPLGVGSDVDAIVAQALKKNPAARYRSAEALADDIQRAQRLQPISAQPDTMRYRLGRFVRRNRLPVAAGAGVVIVLAGLVGAVGVQSWRVREEKNRAEAQASAATAVSDFLVGLFSISAHRLPSHEVSAREFVDEGVRRLRHEMHDDPLVRGRLLSRIGTVYIELRDNHLADSLLTEAADEYERADDVDSADLINLWLARAAISPDGEAVSWYEKAYTELLKTTDPDELPALGLAMQLAEARLFAGDVDAWTRAVDEIEHAFMAAPCDSSTMWVQLATQLSEVAAVRLETDRSLAMKKEALAVCRARRYDALAFGVSQELAERSLESHADYASAAAYAEEGLELSQALGFYDSSSGIILARSRFGMGDVEGLRPLVRDALAAVDHSEPRAEAVYQTHAADLLMELGDPVASLELSRPAEAALHAEFAPGTNVCAGASYHRIRAEVALAADDESVAPYEAELETLIGYAEASKGRIGSWGNSWLLGQVWLELGHVRALLGRHEEALDAYAECRELFDRRLPPDDWRNGKARLWQAESETALGRFDAASATLDEADKRLLSRSDLLGQNVREARTRLNTARGDR